LAERRPDRVVAPLAVDADRGLLLLPDGGPTAASIRSSSDSINQWTTALLGYAELQRSTIESEHELLAAGCPDLRPGADVDRLAGHMAAGHVDDRPHLVEWLREVTDQMSRRIPATIQHDDLSPSNVMLDGRLIDWGDASLGHPFASLLTALMPGNPRRPGNPSDRYRMRDAYLRSWIEPLGLDDDDQTMAWLRHQADLAMLVAPIGRIDTWLRADDGALTLYPDAIDRWLDHLELARTDPGSTSISAPF
ncbi:MAG: phosphotransferase, partial [Actinomycetota bacterium]